MNQLWNLWRQLISFLINNHYITAVRVDWLNMQNRLMMDNEKNKGLKFMIMKNDGQNRKAWEYYNTRHYCRPKTRRLVYYKEAQRLPTVLVAIFLTTNYS